MKKILQDMVSPFVGAVGSGNTSKTASASMAERLRASEVVQEFQDTCANRHDDFPDTQADALNH